MSIVIITGGSRGLGASAAIQCAKRGMGLFSPTTITRKRQRT